jgi:hypothetical protein
MPKRRWNARLKALSDLYIIRDSGDRQCRGGQFALGKLEPEIGEECRWRLLRAFAEHPHEGCRRSARRMGTAMRQHRDVAGRKRDRPSSVAELDDATALDEKVKRRPSVGLWRMIGGPL